MSGGRLGGQPSGVEGSVVRAHGTRGRSSDERDATNPARVAAVSAPVQRGCWTSSAWPGTAVARSVETERHRHGPGCGHAGPAVRAGKPRTSTGPAAGTELWRLPARRLSAASSTQPGTRRAFASGRSSRRRSRPSRTTGLRGARTANPIAQRATAALGAEAMTVGKHIFLGPKAVGNTKTLRPRGQPPRQEHQGHPRDGQQPRCRPSPVTDPGQGSERAADTDSDAFMSGAGTARPSSPSEASGGAGGRHDQAVQRSTGTGGGGTVQRLGRRAAHCPEPGGDDRRPEASGHSGRTMPGSRCSTWEKRSSSQRPVRGQVAPRHASSHIKDVSRSTGFPPSGKTASQGSLAGGGGRDPPLLTGDDLKSLADLPGHHVDSATTEAAHEKRESVSR